MGVRLSVRLSFCLFFCPSLCLYIRMSSGVGGGTSGTSMEVPVVGTPKLSGHQFVDERREEEKIIKRERERQTDRLTQEERLTDRQTDWQTEEERLTDKKRETD